MNNASYYSDLAVQEGSVEGAKIATNGKFVAMPWKMGPRTGSILVAPDDGDYSQLD